MRLKTIEWIANDADGRLVPGHIRMIDQTRLPEELVYLETADLQEIWDAIKQLKVRGAPAIGVAAAMGVVAAIQHEPVESGEDLYKAFTRAADYLATSRPTAVNLFWALERMKQTAIGHLDIRADDLKDILAHEAVDIRDEDAHMCHAIGEHGVSLLKPGQTILTHCNAGGLATAEFGTALSPVYVAQEKEMDIKVYADETRPLLQGSRLTAWELQQAGVDVTLICDNMAATVMKQGRIDAVFVGSDRIAANGDVANKIGTYGVAVLAKEHNIPFYALAPTSTFDLSLASGDEIPIEEREPEEVTCGFGKWTAPRDVKVYSPAFDVTPAKYVTAIICENGIAHPPFEKTLKELTSHH